ncbi:carbonic anhydrase [Reinekea marinisedimentorum]|uniref:carbonic anhydrase n=1 Tax=Reinekea marinisedimentorum TaxID=230495 RepID=A0A4R3I2W2_9GAMM|nr:carbonic anhydrase [Reinekea marinisedimentorum]TCS40119.1 carbonic anhydrase [Reinekea marinisedimentorum]
MLNAQEALQRLKEGNERFVTQMTQQELASEKRRLNLLEGQSPFAIILGCSDSRVPAEIIFDQGLGDLFVIRVAGNIVAPSQVGSIEFAVETFGTPLVVVLGHNSCGAIKATLNAIKNPEQEPSHNLMSIVSRIRPSLETLVETDLQHNEKDLMKFAVRANIRTSVSQIRYSSPYLETQIQSGKLMVVGAQYSLEEGKIHFFEG